jgi:uncharacterized protein (TIGR00730 family)
MSDDLLSPTTSGTDPAFDLDRSETGMKAAMVADFHASAAALRPFATRDKVVIFGSARITESSSLYASVRTLAEIFAASGFVVITGGGPGVMTAGLAGAGSGNALGISVELPFEDPASFPDIPVITQQLFFTRKLAMVRRTKGIIVVPGGFGTMDELFEVLTLLQTGKKSPTPLVLFDPDNSGFFDPLLQLFASFEARHLISPPDLDLFRVVSTEQAAFACVEDFWSNYVSFASDGTRGTIQLHHPLSPAALATLETEFEPFAPLCGDDALKQLTIRFDRRNYGLLHRFIRRLSVSV